MYISRPTISLYFRVPSLPTLFVENGIIFDGLMQQVSIFFWQILHLRVLKMIVTAGKGMNRMSGN